MRHTLAVSFFIFLASLCRGQINCESSFVKDTMFVPESGKIIDGEYIETILKDLSVFRIFWTQEHKYFLRFIVKQNFYFNKTDVLEIRSGNKSYYVKNTKQYQIDKTTGLFVVEVFENYIFSTLKEEGISSLYFAKAETDFTRQDTRQMRDISKCVYTAITGKK